MSTKHFRNLKKLLDFGTFSQGQKTHEQQMGSFLFPPLASGKSEFQSGTVRKLCYYVVVRFLCKISTNVFSLYWFCKMVEFFKKEKVFKKSASVTWKCSLNGVILVKSQTMKKQHPNKIRALPGMLQV